LSRYTFGGGTRGASAGAREVVTTKRDGKEPEVLKDEEINPPKKSHYTEDQMAVVGMSVGIAMSTEFAREKIEVSCWESRPCHDNPQDRERVKAEIADALTRESGERLDACIRAYFPHMLRGN
jgi:hypothetical protein